GGKELELELLAVDDHGVAGVVASVGLDDVVDALTEEVGGLALPLVAPLGSDDHDGGHGDSWGTVGDFLDTRPRAVHRAAWILPSSAEPPLDACPGRGLSPPPPRPGPGAPQRHARTRAARCGTRQRRVLPRFPRAGRGLPQPSRLGSASRRNAVTRSASASSPKIGRAHG